MEILIWTMEFVLDPSWKTILQQEFEKPYFSALFQFVKMQYQSKECFPPENQIFASLNLTPFENIKVVIVGQDPYHSRGQANGLCFSVNNGMKIPPSLSNIFKERQADIAKPMPKTGDLQNWAKQGVLMLNTTLTVSCGLPGSHQNQGWEAFTDAIIKKINTDKSNIVFILWGAFAQKKKAFLNNENHFVLESTHPSPFSAHKGFLGSKPFSKTNDYLKKKGLEPIEW
ncbi:MAG: uracil-DNA glycosylase [Cytophagales bacterium]